MLDEQKLRVLITSDNDSNAAIISSLKSPKYGNEVDRNKSIVQEGERKLKAIQYQMLDLEHNILQVRHRVRITHIGLLMNHLCVGKRFTYCIMCSYRPYDVI
jgi:hypothetical protein